MAPPVRRAEDSPEWQFASVDSAGLQGSAPTTPVNEFANAWPNDIAPQESSRNAEAGSAFTLGSYRRNRQPLSPYRSLQDRDQSTVPLVGGQSLDPLGNQPGVGPLGRTFPSVNDPNLAEDPGFGLSVPYDVAANGTAEVFDNDGDGFGTPTSSTKTRCRVTWKMPTFWSQRPQTWSQPAACIHRALPSAILQAKSADSGLGRNRSRVHCWRISLRRDCRPVRCGSTRRRTPHSHTCPSPELIPMSYGTRHCSPHGQSVELENRFTGWVDVDITDAGPAEAVAAGQSPKASGLLFDEVHTSVLPVHHYVLGHLG